MEYVVCAPRPFRSVFYWDELLFWVLDHCHDRGHGGHGVNWSTLFASAGAKTPRPVASYSSTISVDRSRSGDRLPVDVQPPLTCSRSLKRRVSTTYSMPTWLMPRGGCWVIRLASLQAMASPYI